MKRPIIKTVLLLTIILVATACSYIEHSTKEGYYEARWPDGKVKMIKYYGKDEKINGASMNFQSDGKLGSFIYMRNDSLINGPSIGFYDDGSINQMDTYLDGKREGVSVHYHPKGYLTRKSYYVNGLKEGREYLFDYETGDTAKIMVYRKGVAIDSIIRRQMENPY